MNLMKSYFPTKPMNQFMGLVAFENSQGYEANHA